jgi:hypothetical protein
MASLSISRTTRQAVGFEILDLTLSGEQLAILQMEIVGSKYDLAHGSDAEATACLMLAAVDTAMRLLG